QKLIAASALLCGRTTASASDLWVLRYVWDRAEQIAPLAALVNGILKNEPDAGIRHPLASVPERVDAEGLAKQPDALEAKIAAGTTSLSALARLREQTTTVADRAAWVADDATRRHLTDRAGRLLSKIGGEQ